MDGHTAYKHRPSITDVLVTFSPDIKELSGEAIKWLREHRRFECFVQHNPVTGDPPTVTMRFDSPQDLSRNHERCRTDLERIINYAK